MDNDPPPIDPALQDLITQLDQVCGNGGDIYRAIAGIERAAGGYARLSQRQALQVLKRLKKKEAVALLLLVFARLDGPLFRGLEPSFADDPDPELRIVRYWGWVIEPVRQNESDTEKELFWRPAYMTLLFEAVSPIEVQREFALLLRSSEDPEAVEFLLTSMKNSPDPLIRNYCALLLKPSRELGQVTEGYRQLLAHDSSAAVRRTAATLMSGIPLESNRDALRRAFEGDPDKDVRMTAVQALADGADEKTVAYLIDTYSRAHSIAEQRAIVVGVSHSLSSASTSFLADVVRGQCHVAVMADAIKRLGMRHNDPVATRAVVGTLTSNDSYLRELAVIALGNMDDVSAVSTLDREARQDPDEDVRHSAQEALQKLRK